MRMIPAAAFSPGLIELEASSPTHSSRGSAFELEQDLRARVELGGRKVGCLLLNPILFALPPFLVSLLPLAVLIECRIDFGDALKLCKKAEGKREKGRGGGRASYSFFIPLLKGRKRARKWKKSALNLLFPFPLLPLSLNWFSSILVA